MKTPICLIQEKTGFICLIVYQNMIVQGQASTQARNSTIWNMVSLEKQSFAKCAYHTLPWLVIGFFLLEILLQGGGYCSLEINWFCLGWEICRDDRVGQLEESDDLFEQAWCLHMKERMCSICEISHWVAVMWQGRWYMGYMWSLCRQATVPEMKWNLR